MRILGVLRASGAISEDDARQLVAEWRSGQHAAAASEVPSVSRLDDAEYWSPRFLRDLSTANASQTRHGLATRVTRDVLSKGDVCLRIRCAR
jgi:hypothetical protein